MAVVVKVCGLTRAADAALATALGAAYLGFIFARGATARAVENALRVAHRCLRFRITSMLPVT